MPRLGDGLLKNGVIERAGANNSKWVSNIGFTYAAGILRITDAKGNELTPLNPGFITMPSTVSPGQLVVLKVTKGYEFHDLASGSSDLTGFGFGINEGVDSPGDVYFYVGVANRADSDLNGVDGDSCFYLGRKAFAQTPALAANIGDLGAIAPTDTIDSMLMMLDLTTANYVNLIGMTLFSIRMRWTFASTDWTVQALSALLDQQTFSAIGANWAPGTVKMPFYMAAAPLGWTIDSSVNDAFIRISSTTGGVTGGAFSDLSHNHTLGSHTHTDGSYAARVNFSDTSGSARCYYDLAALPSWTSDLVHDTDQFISGNNLSFTTGAKVDGVSGGPSTNNTSTETIAHGSAQHAYADFIICVNQ